LKEALVMSEKHGKRYTPRFKFQVVMEILGGTKAVGQIARCYGVHPVTLAHWKKEFIEKGPEIFSQQTTIQEYERRIEELERLIGHKEVEFALLKNFLAGSSPRGKKLS
jgi:transposase-like protein